MNAHHDEEFTEDFFLSDALDAEILMHREAHFGGQFNIMLEYYVKGGIGVQSEFRLERIQQLALVEREMKENLAAVYLTGPDAEKIANAKEAYKKLQDLYDNDRIKSSYPLLIADLVLSESEDPIEEIEAIVKEKGYIVPHLLNILRSEEFADPLFPGYGRAPSLAIRCLGLIGDKQAIITLFEAIGSGDFFDEEAILNALHAIGQPAKDFLLKVVKGRPLNVDNEKAAIALVEFKNDPEVAKNCFELLKQKDVRRDAALSTYLILACEGLQGDDNRSSFIKLIEDPATPSILHHDIKSIAKGWKIK